MKKICITFLISFFITILIFILKEETISISYIELKGNKIINLVSFEQFQEPGYIAINEKGKNITDKVKVSLPKINGNGTYEITYTIEEENIIEKRYLVINNEYKDYYDKINNESRNWWSNNKKDGNRPTGGYDIEELKKYNAFFLGKDEKVIYLTFDEGSTETYLEEIVEVLNKNNVQATFFLCKTYIKKNPELMKRMIEKGNSIGNHTANHLNMSTLANKENYSKYLDEIIDVEKTFYEVTGKSLDKVYREPRGEWSLRSLQIIKDLGYKSFFYSADYLDWNGEVTKEYAYNELKKRVHNGAIYLIHPTNKGNYLAMNDFIKDLKKEGYTFDLVKNIS